MPSFRQANLSGGILRPELWGRNDIPKYPSFLRRQENFYSTPTGQSSNRPGTTYGALAKTGATSFRAAPFIFGANQAYVIEFTNLAFRVFQNGVPILANGGSSDTITTTYATADLPYLKYSQVGDEMFIACVGKPTRKIQRLGATNWAIVDVVYTRVATTPTGLAFSGSINQTGDGQTHIAKEWSWKVTGWSVDAYGNLIEESVASAALSPPTTGKCVVNESYPVTISWTSTGAPRYSIYRGRNGLFGYVGDAVAQTTFRDDGQVPVLSECPPLNRDPTASSQYPAVIGFYQQRMVIGNQPAAPEWVYLSQTGIFNNFDYQEPAKADDSTDFGVASKQYEEIRNFAAVDDSLLIFTSGVEWVGNNGSGGPVVANDAIWLRPQSYWGSSWLDTIQVGNRILFQSVNGYPIRVMEGDPNYAAKWQSRDLTLFAGLTQDFPIMGWCYQRIPHRLVWGYDANGALYSITFDTETDTYAWARHGLSGGRVRAIACIPEGGEDVVYLWVERTKGLAGSSTYYTVERMRPRRDDNPVLTTNNYLDCSYHFDGSNTNRAVRLRVTAANYNVGTTCTVIAEAATFTAGSVGQFVFLHPKSPAHTVKIRIDTYTDTTHVNGTIVANPIDSSWPVNRTGMAAWAAGSFPALPPWSPVPGDVSGTTLPMDQSDWGIAKTSFTLSDTTLYNAAQSVTVKADGVQVSPATFTGTALTLTSPACFVTIGIPYSQVMETLDVPPTQNDTTLNTRIVRKAAFELSRTALGFKVGEDASDAASLSTWAPDVGEEGTADFGPGSEDQTYSGLAYVPIQSSWSRDGRICLVNTAPFPVTVSAIIREVEFGGT